MKIGEARWHWFSGQTNQVDICFFSETFLSTLSLQFRSSFHLTFLLIFWGRTILFEKSISDLARPPDPYWPSLQSALHNIPCENFKIKCKERFLMWSSNYCSMKSSKLYVPIACSFNNVVWMYNDEETINHLKLEQKKFELCFKFNQNILDKKKYFNKIFEQTTLPRGRGGGE